LPKERAERVEWIDEEPSVSVVERWGMLHYMSGEEDKTPRLLVAG
jgi:hypothetical protein